MTSCHVGEAAVATASELPAPPRIACYSHDTVGLGHICRNIAVATSMINSWPGADALLLTGNPEATSLWLPPRTDVVTLPTLTKDVSGRYRSRTLNASLDTVVTMRSAVIEAAIGSFAPDLLIVDKVPRGVAGELIPTLRRLRSECGTKIVLGLREILDDPIAAVADWTRTRSTEAVQQFYDAIWIYGDRRVYDPIAEYGMPREVAERCVFTGYLAADRFVGADGSRPGSRPSGRPYVLCTVGGGQDGVDVVETFVRTPLPAGHEGVIVCGPFMPEPDRERVHAAAADTDHMTVLDFVPDLHQLIERAAAVVSMAGYNSVCEVLATDRPALLVPRTRPRAEQLVRAQRLAELGVADTIPLDRLTRDGLAAWSASAVSGGVGCGGSRSTVDVDGLRRLPGIAERLLAGSTAEQSTGHAQPRGVDHRAA